MVIPAGCTRWCLIPPHPPRILLGLIRTNWVLCSCAMHDNGPLWTCPSSVILLCAARAACVACGLLGVVDCELWTGFCQRG